MVGWIISSYPQNWPELVIVCLSYISCLISCILMCIYLYFFFCTQISWLPICYGVRWGRRSPNRPRSLDCLLLYDRDGLMGQHESQYWNILKWCHESKMILTLTSPRRPYQVISTANDVASSRRFHLTDVTSWQPARFLWFISEVCWESSMKPL